MSEQLPAIVRNIGMPLHHANVLACDIKTPWPYKSMWFLSRAAAAAFRKNIRDSGSLEMNIGKYLRYKRTDNIFL